MSFFSNYGSFPLVFILDVKYLFFKTNYKYLKLKISKTRLLLSFPKPALLWSLLSLNAISFLSVAFGKILGVIIDLFFTSRLISDSSEKIFKQIFRVNPNYNHFSVPLISLSYIKCPLFSAWIFQCILNGKLLPIYRISSMNQLEWSL